MKLRINPSAATMARAIRAPRGNFLKVIGVTPYPNAVGARALQSRGIGLAGADAHGAVDAVDEDLAVADLAGLGGPYDGVDDFVDLIGRDRRFDLDLGQKADGVF